MKRSRPVSVTWLLRFLTSSRSSSLSELPFITLPAKQYALQNSLSSPFSLPSSKPSSIFFSSATVRLLTTKLSTDAENSEKEEDPFQCEDWTDEERETSDGWEEEEEEDVEPEIGDGGDGGGVVLQGVPWGEQALSLAHDVLLPFADDIKLFSFKTTPRGYIYVRLDKLSNKYGCPTIEELESFNREFKKILNEAGERGEIPDDLALEVSTPGAERLLKIPDELDRFKDMPMWVRYNEGELSKWVEKDGIFMLESVETSSETCVWKLANIKENRDPLSKGRPLSRKQRDWRLNLPFDMHRKVTLYLEC